MTKIDPRKGAPPFTVNDADLERAKISYLAQFTHVGCGGAPLAYRATGELGCTGCKISWPGNGPLGEAVERTGAFRSMVVR